MIRFLHQWKLGKNPSPRWHLWVQIPEGRGFESHLELGFFPSFHLMQKTYHVLLLQKTHLVISMSPLFKLRYSAVTVPQDCCTDKNNLLLLEHVSKRGKPCLHICNILTQACKNCLFRALRWYGWCAIIYIPFSIPSAI